MAGYIRPKHTSLTLFIILFQECCLHPSHSIDLTIHYGRVGWFCLGVLCKEVALDVLHCQPMRWLVSVSKLCTVQLRPLPYWTSKDFVATFGVKQFNVLVLLGVLGGLLDTGSCCFCFSMRGTLLHRRLCTSRSTFCAKQTAGVNKYRLIWKCVRFSLRIWS